MPSESRSLNLYLADIRTACEKILRYTQGMNRDAFLANELIFDATVRNIEIIGEAAKQVPEPIRAAYTQIDWRRIAGMRDIVAHAYFGLDVDIIWDVIQNKIPYLLTEVEQILNQASK